jgi:hypothetical protein
MLTGIVTATLESYSTIDSFEDVIEGGGARRIEHRRVISYGVAVLLSELHDWLDENISYRRGTAWRR